MSADLSFKKVRTGLWRSASGWEIGCPATTRYEVYDATGARRGVRPTFDGALALALRLMTVVEGAHRSG